jgi:hypothetical protein
MGRIEEEGEGLIRKEEVYRGRGRSEEKEER